MGVELFSYVNTSVGFVLHILRTEIEDITRWREDMNFMFEWHEQRCCSCHENIRFISSSYRVISTFSFYYINLLMAAFLTIFQRFPTTFRRFSKTFSKLFRRPDERFRTFSENFRKFPKMSEDSRRLLRKTRRCFDDTPTNLSTIKETNLISV